MKTIMYLLPLALVAYGCTTPDQPAVEESAPTSSVTLPYTPLYSSNVNQNISDDDLLVVLNSYKAWETGDIEGLRSAFGDSLAFNGWDGTEFSGSPDELLSTWKESRDSIASVKIDMAVWTKNNFPDKREKNITVWYTETDTYKDGRVTKADWHDINGITDGKITWYAQYKRPYKSK